jgi:hypothetical protein
MSSSIYCESDSSYRVCRQEKISDDIHDLYTITISNKEDNLEYPKRLVGIELAKVVINGKIKSSVLKLNDDDIKDLYSLIVFLHKMYKKSDGIVRENFFSYCSKFLTKQIKSSESKNELKLFLMIMNHRFYKDQNNRLNFLMEYQSIFNPIILSNRQGKCVVELHHILGGRYE